MLHNIKNDLHDGSTERRFRLPNVTLLVTLRCSLAVAQR